MSADGRDRHPDIEKLLAELTLDEKAAFTAGADMWDIAGVPRLGIPRLRTTDGPAGARGSALLGSGAVSAACAPCASALGATWDPVLVEQVGGLIGREARDKSARFLLAPTVNLHRTPIGGRTFECYSEDPLLSGRAAAGFIRGVQSHGVAATVKHFVANDAEFERATISSDLDERTLRELYLRPFELAVKEGGVLALMTAYNRVNGTWVTEDHRLLTSILRDEWGFEGIVMTDWFGIASTVESVRAGLDLEMPGTARAYGSVLADAVRDGRVSEDALDLIVRRWLTVIDRLGAWDDGELTESSVDRPEDRVVLRRAAAESCVLLTNDGVLPLDPAADLRVALIGSQAAVPHIMGGGSAQLIPHSLTSIREVMRDRLGDRLEYEPGCPIDRTTRHIEGSALRTPTGEPGVRIDLWTGFDTAGDPVTTVHRSSTRILFFDEPAPGVGTEFSARVTGVYTPERGGRHVITLTETGEACLFLDGELVIDVAPSDGPRGSEAFGMASAEREVEIELEAGRPIEIVTEYRSRGAAMFYMHKVGLRAVRTGREIDDAVAAAAAADVAVVVVGTSDEWETEGHDRESMTLPGDQDELVRRVAAVNPRTVVLINAGSPVGMPWAHEVAAVVQVWLGGQEMAAAVDAVVFGDAEPAGRLPTTLPLRIEHTPAHGSFPGENDHVRYGEGLLMGYRWYDTRRLPVAFPFGHGGSYTTFSWGDATVSSTEVPAGGTITVSVPVTNTGSRRGAEVVQCYVAPPAGLLSRPDRELAGWAKVWLDPGESTVATIELDERAFAHWDPTSPDRALLAERSSAHPLVALGDRRTEPGWWIAAGAYGVEVGASAADLRQRLEVSATERRIGP